MAAVKNFGQSPGTSRAPERRQWTQTPKWHWRYWFGYRMRLAVGWRNGIRTFAYRSHEHHARVILEATAFNVPLSYYDPASNNAASDWRDAQQAPQQQTSGGRKPKI